MADFNHTDALIAKLYRRGLTLERIAARLGRPGDTQRVLAGLARLNIEVTPYLDKEGTNVLPT